MNFPQIQVFADNAQVFSGPLDKPTELGRENDDDCGVVFEPRPIPGGTRVAIADKEKTALSRELMMITPLDGDQVQVDNRSKSNIIHVETQEPIWPKQLRKLALPVTLTATDRRIEISRARSAAVLAPISMNEPMLPPGSDDQSSENLSSRFQLTGKLSDDVNKRLIDWLGAVTRVLQSAMASIDFYDRAAKEMVELIGLDSGRVLDILDDGRWTVAAAYHRGTPRRTSEWLPISSLIRQAIQEKRTCWTMPAADSRKLTATVGTEDVTTAVASPLLDRGGKVIGLLYGDRHTTGSRVGATIGKLEATLVETLARGVSTGRARVEQERVAAAAQVRFEQFFTPELSRHLAANADLLTRRDTEVTLLFADIRRFSAISEQLGAEVTMKWLSEVMGKMADCAAMYEGTLVDYIGDELMVMWGAPAPQPDHATRACQTALEMAREVKELNKKWEHDLGQRTQLGFGINTGNARVGNVGFERKFRYAPFGNTVNTASRVQGATKYLGTDVVVTETTFRQLRGAIVSRRLCSVRVINIEEPIMLYELCPDETPEIKTLCQQYEDGLAAYEAEELPQSINILSEILRKHPEDGPTLLLLSRAVESLLDRDAKFNPVFELPGK